MASGFRCLYSCLHISQAFKFYNIQIKNWLRKLWIVGSMPLILRQVLHSLIRRYEYITSLNSYIFCNCIWQRKESSASSNIYKQCFQLFPANKLQVDLSDPPFRTISFSQQIVTSSSTNKLLALSFKFMK